MAFATPASSSSGSAIPRVLRRVGILGGSFDPITEGHLTLAAGVVQSGAVDEVWLMPCGERPDKPSLTTSVMHRYIMTQI